jgi:hypothetical protein
MYVEFIRISVAKMSEKRKLAATKGKAKTAKVKSTAERSIKKAALNQCIQDNLCEIRSIQAELEQLTKERETLCNGDVHVLHLVPS